jgi:excisionase family DNA binding protein
MTWLTLKEASDQLGIHPTTLRRWADKGDIPYMRTPGGHRRFAQDDLDAFAKHQKRRAYNTIEKTWAERTVIRTREGIKTQSHERWITIFDEESRLEQRELGRRLMGLLLQFISSAEPSNEMLREAHEIGACYGQNSQETGLSLTEALEATLFFRDMVVESAIQLPRSTRSRSASNLRLLRRINQIMNIVQLAIAEYYESSALPRN